MPVSVSRLAFLLSQSAVFVSRVEMALLDRAVVIMQEAGSVQHHTQRVALAAQVIKDPSRNAQNFAPFISQLAAVRNTTTMEDEGARTTIDDGALVTAIATAWNLMAGIPNE